MKRGIRFDYDNRLIKADMPTGNVEYLYSGLGEPVAKRVNNQLVVYPAGTQFDCRIEVV